jgi:hypothetical protein
MFKTALGAILLAISVSGINGQILSSQVKRAAGLAKMEGLSNSRIAFSAGVDAQLDFGDRAGLVFDLGYALRGRKEVLIGGSSQLENY